MAEGPYWMDISCIAKTDREREEEFLLCYLLKENLECMEVSYGNSSPVEWLRVKIRGIVSKGNLTVCFCL